MTDKATFPVQLRPPRQGDVVRWPYADAASAPVDQRDVAAVAVRVLLDDRHIGAEYVLTGPESLTHAAQVATIGSVLGRELRFESLSPDAYRSAVRTLPRSPA